MARDTDVGDGARRRVGSRRSKSVRLAVVPLLAAAFLSGDLLHRSGLARPRRSLVYGAVGVAAQAVGFVVLDLLTPGRLNVICANEKLHPATLVSAAVQVSVALVVCASLT